MKQVFVGIDISKGKSTYIAINNQGKKIPGPTTVVNSKSSIDKILDSLKEYLPEEILFAMEVTSNYWENICSYLKDSYPSDFDILNSIKGIRLGTIATFIACIGDVSRFSSSSKLISYIGFYPKIFESGKYRKKNPCMQKAGPKELRYILYLSSVASIKHNPELRKYYLDRVSAGMPGKKALIKVALKIAKMMYSMLKSRSSYCGSRVFFQETPILVS